MSDRAKTTNETTDNSVLCALAELGALEDGRIEREKKAQAAATAAALEAKEKAARAEAQRMAADEAARVEAQLRAAIEIDAKAKAEADRDQRMAAMRAELESIQTERSVLRAEVLSRGTARPETPRRGYGMAFGLSSVVAAALAGALVVQAQRSEPAAPRYVPAVPVIEHAPSVLEVDEIEPVSAPVVEAVEVEAPVAPAVRPHRHPPRDRSHETATEDRHALDRDLDFGEGEGLLPGDAHRAR
jgi:hypothetical protein